MRLSACIFVLALAGCSEAVHLGGDPDDPVTLVLEFTLYGEGESSPGPHCGTARIQDDTAVVERDEPALDGKRPLLVVLPHLSGGWASLGSEGYAKSLPADVRTGIPDEAQPIVRIGWLNGTATVAGTAVALPHHFESRDTDGEWTANGTLREGPSRIRTFTLRNCA